MTEDLSVIDAPVIIYTNKNKDDPSSYIKDEGLERLVTVMEKKEVQGQSVFAEVGNWLTRNP